ncbi:MAG TPA: DUF697 domain-containing protein [Bryobacteraceae bacterium]|nr:DUF697 domain-containing protein [Bryobacteraceae bacterium]
MAIKHEQAATIDVPSEPITAQAGPEAGANQQANGAADAVTVLALRRIKCDMAITKHVALATGAGFLPVPAADFLAVTGVQISLLYRLCKVYRVEFSKEAARSVITSLVGAAVPGIEARFLASGLKLIPGLGTLAGIFITPSVAGATTYAVGKVFVQHLESGGTLLTFNASKMKDHFEQALNEGKRVVAGEAKS